MTSLDAKFTMLLRELIQHEVNVITDSDWFQEKVDEAVEIGAVGIAFLSGSHPGNDKRVEATNLLFDSFSKICAHATSQDTNLKVVLETFDFDIDKKA